MRKLLEWRRYFAATNPKAKPNGYVNWGQGYPLRLERLVRAARAGRCGALQHPFAPPPTPLYQINSLCDITVCSGYCYLLNDTFVRSPQVPVIDETSTTGT